MKTIIAIATLAAATVASAQTDVSTGRGTFLDRNGSIAYDASARRLTVTTSQAVTRSYAGNGSFINTSIPGGVTTLTLDFAAGLTESYTVDTITFPSGNGGRSILRLLTGTVTGLTLDISSPTLNYLSLTLDPGQTVPLTFAEDAGFYFTRDGVITEAPGLRNTSIAFDTSLARAFPIGGPGYSFTSELPDYVQTVDNPAFPFVLLLGVFRSTSGLDFTGTTSFVGPAGDFTGLGAFAFRSAAVPEPASWALMIAGFGLVGGALRARRPRIFA